jgi:hypothetical protein
MLWNFTLVVQESIYIPWTLSFIEKKITEKSIVFGGINKRQISLTYH